MPGTLFVVATPIGNLEDLTFRALRTLREVDLIAAEDTRRTAKLLAHYEIRKSMVSLHEHNEYREAARLVARLAQGESIALVSDAGTPGIADPGARLVRTAREAGIPVIPIPGPSAITAALSVAGLDAPEFVFMGFAPPKSTTRMEWLRDLAIEPKAIVFFEVPHRIRACVADMAIVFGKRHILALREISKVNYELVEQSKISTVRELGEFVIVISPMDDGAATDGQALKAAEIFGRMADISGLDPRRIEMASAVAAGVSISASGKALRHGRKLAKQQKMSKP